MILVKRNFFLTGFAIILLACNNSAIPPYEAPVKVASNSVSAPQSGSATYLGNEAVMIQHAGTKILFDPFFHNSYRIYQLVPDYIRTALFSGTAPYDNIAAIFISHAHADHYFAPDLVDFLFAHSNTHLIAPQQAIDSLLTLKDSKDLSSIKNRLHPINLSYQDMPIELSIGNLNIDAVRIPHAGWPSRANVSNLVYRVSLNNEITVIHMGDADPNDEHFKPLIAHWNKKVTHTAFPPYWFHLSKSGKLILSDRINATDNIGVHVPVAVPQDLIRTGARYFSKPGERHTINP